MTAVSNQPQSGRPSSTGSTTTSRVSGRQLDFVSVRLSARDWSIVLDLYRLRLLSGEQIERLHFAALTGRSREVVRGRVLRRLVDWRVVQPLERRIGGAKRGSAGAVYTLDALGQRLALDRLAAETASGRVRRPGQPGERFQAHTLAVSQLYVNLVANQSTVAVQFETEPAAWWPNGLGGFIKPDAYAQLSSSRFVDHWWLEVDQATESLPTIRRKLVAYLDFYQRGQLGPGDVMPRVLLSTITVQRQQAMAELVEHMPEPASQLFVASTHGTAQRALLASFTE